MNTYPADEQRISEVERGRSWEAILPLPPGKSLSVGDTILFALSFFRAGQLPTYIKGGDSVLVSLTDVVDLDETDPASGQALFRVCWNPLGQGVSLDTATRSGESPSLSQFVLNGHVVSTRLPSRRRPRASPVSLTTPLNFPHPSGSAACPAYHLGDTPGVISPIRPPR